MSTVQNVPYLAATNIGFYSLLILQDQKFEGAVTFAVSGFNLVPLCISNIIIGSC